MLFCFQQQDNTILRHKLFQNTQYSTCNIFK